MSELCFHKNWILDLKYKFYENVIRKRSKIMKQNCKYDSKRDIMEVVEGLSVNLDKALTSGEIRDTSVPAQYNMQKELAEVGNRVSEPFDVIEYERAYTRIRKQIKDKKKDDNE